VHRLGRENVARGANNSAETSRCGGRRALQFRNNSFRRDLAWHARSKVHFEGPFDVYRRKPAVIPARHFVTKGESKKDRQIRHAVFCCLFRASVYAITTADPASFVQIRMRASDWLGAAAHVREICKRAFTVGRTFFRKLVSLPGNSCDCRWSRGGAERRDENTATTTSHDTWLIFAVDLPWGQPISAFEVETDRLHSSRALTLRATWRIFCVFLFSSVV